MDKTTITVKTTITAPIEKVWEMWIKPVHITNWNFASKDWKCPSAINDLKPNGEFIWRMESKDGSVGFDFTGTYTKVIANELISYKIGDGRKVDILFLKQGNTIEVNQTFEAEGKNSDEQQKLGWQAILGNFKIYVEESIK